MNSRVVEHLEEVIEAKERWVEHQKGVRKIYERDMDKLDKEIEENEREIEDFKRVIDILDNNSETEEIFDPFE